MAFSADERKAIVAQYSVPAKDRPSLKELALMFNSCPSNIARALAEERVTELQAYKCAWERELLSILKMNGLDTSDKLTSFIRKAKLNEQQHSED